MSLHQATPAAADASEAAYQARLFGRYLLVDRLSRGGMGELFIARHGLSGFEKRVVIKKILPHLAADAEFLTRFVDEAQVAVQLQHANIAQVFEVGRVDDEYFLAIEHIEGRDLRATLAALAEQGRRMPPTIALFIAREIAAGLAYAHRRTDDGGKSLDLVHCDISPPNVMMSFDGETKIIDFGIARSARRLSQTDPNRGFGKFGYMSPEQLVRGVVVDHRTDIYAAGVLLFEMLTGRKLFETDGEPDYRALARNVIRGVHPLPGALDPELARFDAVVARAVNATVAERYQSAAELRDAIQTLLAGLDPTFNADHLATFMRDVFGERREATSRLDARALAHWRRELTQQAAATISFARADGAAPGALVPPAPPTVAVADGTRNVTLELELDGSEAEPRVAEETADVVARGRRIWVPLALASAAALVAGLTVYTIASAASDRGTPAVAAAPPPAAAAAVVVPPSVASPAVAAAPPVEDGAPIEAPDVRPLEPGPAAPRRARRARSVRAPMPAAAPAPDAHVVEDQFRSAHREYQDFRSRFGSRLEREWNDLAHFATFGKSPDKLAEFEKRIRAFRGLMSAAGD